MHKYVLCLMLIIVISQCVLADSKIDLEKYTQLLKQGDYTTIQNELVPELNEFEERGKDLGLDNEEIIKARNIIADSFRLQKKYLDAYDWYSYTYDVYFDPYAAYYSEIFMLVKIPKHFNPEKVYYDELYFGQQGSSSKNEEILHCILLKLQDNYNSEQKQQFFKEMAFYVKETNWTTQLVKFLAKEISLESLLANVPLEKSGVVKVYVGLYYELTGNIQKSHEMYRQALNSKENNEIEFIIASNRLGLFSLNYIYENGKNSNKLVNSFSLKSSSSLKNYGISNTVDGSLDSAWVEGTKGNGVNEWIEFTFNSKKEIRHLNIANGYAKNESIYFANNRVKKIRISFDDGTYKEFDLNDGVLKTQTISLPNPKITKTLKISILDVYLGIKYDDTCISEIYFE